MKNLLELVLSTPAPTPRPADASPPTAGFASLAGKYINPAYGEIELCFVGLTTDGPQSASCEEIAKNVNVTLPGAVNASMPAYVSKWDNAWLSHVVFTHYQGDMFNVTSYMSEVSYLGNIHIPLKTNGARFEQSTGDANEPFWARPAYAGALAIFESVGTGFGLTGNFWGAAVTEEPQGVSLMEKSEVWFTKSGEARRGLRGRYML